MLRRDCPCRILDRASSPTYEECCGRFHARTTWPETAEELMRSRYSAFVLGLDDWVFVTWHPRTRPDEAAAGDGSGWLGLEITDLVGGGPDDGEGVVEFVAHHTEGELRERSHFARRAGRWLYLDGVIDTRA